MRMQFFNIGLLNVMHSAYARVSIFVTLVTCWHAHANTGLTRISTSQVQHVNNLINVVPFAAGRQCRHGGLAGNLQLGTNTNCPCSCIVASTEQCHDTWQSWQRPSAALPVVACGRRHLPISSCQIHVDQQTAIGRLLLLAREHRTVYLLLSAPMPHTTLSKRP